MEKGSESSVSNPAGREPSEVERLAEKVVLQLDGPPISGERDLKHRVALVAELLTAFEASVRDRAFQEGIDELERLAKNGTKRAWTFARLLEALRARKEPRDDAHKD